MNKSDYTIPIIISNKDIGRIIFSPKDDNQYDIKFNFFQQKFALQLYNLFAWRPTVGFVPESEDLEITYHCAQGNKSPMIHLKKEHVNEGERRYYTLPVPNVRTPRSDTIFPIPLCKIEIPDQILQEASPYAKTVSA